MSEKLPPDQAEKIRWGLYFLLSESIEHKCGLQPRREVMEPVGLHCHPFGLHATEPPIPPYSNQRGPLQLVGSPRQTPISIFNFSRLIAQELAEYSQAQRPHYLRVIHIQAGYSWVFFEIGLNNVVYICGGCSDKAGTNGAIGKSHLMALFQLLALISGLEIEEVTITEGAQERFDQLEIELIDASTNRLLVTRPLTL